MGLGFEVESLGLVFRGCRSRDWTAARRWRTALPILVIVAAVTTVSLLPWNRMGIIATTLCVTVVSSFTIDGPPSPKPYVLNPKT